MLRTGVIKVCQELVKISVDKILERHIFEYFHTYTKTN